MTNPVKVWRYSLPNVQHQGWAIIFVDSIGCFTALSDWGDVGYRWPEQGWGEGDFRKFLLSLDDSYLTGKLGRGRKEYDREGTLAAVRERIAELPQKKQEEELELLKRHDDLHNDHNFSQWYTDTNLEDAGELHCQQTVSDVTRFVEHVMPRLREVLKAELKAEAPTEGEVHAG